MSDKLSSITRDGKALFLAYDHGFEHGPGDFNEASVNPQYILNLAVKGGFTGVILQPGVAKRYYPAFLERVPLVLKLNGKTNLRKDPDESYGPLVCSVAEAVDIFGAKAVGYTFYPGSKYEPLMLKELSQVVREARTWGVPVVSWIYPRGKDIADEQAPEIVAYAARLALELGVDLAKVKWPGSQIAFEIAVKSAAPVGLVLAGGERRSPSRFLRMVKAVMAAGGVGVAVGRNVWQAEEPLEITKKIKEIIFSQPE